MAFRASPTFDALSTTWWDESGVLHGLGVLLNPVRVPFVTRVLESQLGPGNHLLIDLGAGGGLLADALATHGHSVVALDPSVPSLEAGRDHGAATVSDVGFLGGRGEHLPFGEAPSMPSSAWRYSSTSTIPSR